jgi:hypothetical protein
MSARFVLGALNGVPRWRPEAVSPSEVDRIADQLVAHVITGIGAAPRHARRPDHPPGHRPTDGDGDRAR